MKSVSLNLVPPSPVTDQIKIEIRGAVRNDNSFPRTVKVRFYLDAIQEDTLLYEQVVRIPARSIKFVSFYYPAKGWRGIKTIIMSVICGEDNISCFKQLEVKPSITRSPKVLGGAWIGFLHWSEEEGKYWNDCLRTFTEADWCETIRGMYRSGMKLIIIQETWRNPTYYGAHYHSMTAANYKDQYKGKSFYPSSLWHSRMDIPAHDPVEAVLSEADNLGMNVMLGVGNYAHFDFTAGSLAWHKDVFSELLQRYGKHPSLYGWYISEEINGRIKPHEMRYWYKTDEFRDEVMTFFREISNLKNRLAPETVIMLAPDSHYSHEAEEIWRYLAGYCDVFCVQGYQRHPVDGVPVEENIRRMQSICDSAGNHLWMDMEIFGFEHPDKNSPQREGYFCRLRDGTEEFTHVPLIPQRMELIKEEFNRFHQFEFICAYQYPGILCAPDATKKPGGTRAVEFFIEYEEYLRRKG